MIVQIHKQCRNYNAKVMLAARKSEMVKLFNSSVSQLTLYLCDHCCHKVSENGSRFCNGSQI